jgi:hypothetical protein
MLGCLWCLGVPTYRLQNTGKVLNFVLTHSVSQSEKTLLFKKPEPARVFHTMSFSKHKVLSDIKAEAFLASCLRPENQANEDIVFACMPE